MASNNRRVSFSQSEQQQRTSYSPYCALSKTDLDEGDTQQTTPTEHLANATVVSSPLSSATQRRSSNLKPSTTNHRRSSKRKKSAVIVNKTGRKQFLERTDLEHQDWSSQSLLLIPVEVFGFVTLRRLILSHNNLSGVPSEICSLTSLEYLDMSCNPLIMEDDAAGDSCFPEEFYLLTNLHTLILTDCGLMLIPAVIWNTVSLQVLDLSRNKVGYIAGELDRFFEHPLSADLSFDYALQRRLMRVLSLYAGNLIDIRQLRLCWMNLVTLPPEIGVCDQLESIDLTGNPLDHLPETLVECRRLLELKLNYKGFQKLLDEYIVQLIDEGRVQSQHIPSVIFELENLRTLDLDQSKINSIPIEQSLSSLTELHLAHNSFLQIPEAVCTMAQLSMLDMSYNRICAIPDCLVNLKRLERLHLSHNELTSLSATFASLPSLRILIIRHNQIGTIEKKLAESQSLLVLDLSYNLLTSLPYEFCELSQLQALDLRYNRLEYLPWSIRQMTGLTSMNCFDDALHRTGLHLLGNPILDPPNHVWKSTDIQALFSYIDDKETSRLTSFYHLKLIFIGPKRCGKTALAVKLLHHRKLVSSTRTTLDTHISLLQQKHQSTSTSNRTRHGSQLTIESACPPSLRMYPFTERIMNMFHKATFTTKNNLYCTIFDVTSEPSYEMLYPLIYDANALYILPVDLTSLLNTSQDTATSDSIHRDEDQPALVDIKSLLTDDWLYNHIFRYLVAVSEHCERVFVAIIGLLRNPRSVTETEHGQTTLNEVHSRVNTFLLDGDDQRQNINHYSYLFPTPIQLSDEDMVTFFVEQLEMIAQQWNLRHHKFKASFVKQRLGFHQDDTLIGNYETSFRHFQERTPWASYPIDDDGDATESNRLIIEDEISQMSFDQCLDYLQLTGDILCFGRRPHLIILRQPHYLVNIILAHTLFRPDLHRWLDYHTNVVFRYSGYYPSEELFHIDRQRLLTHGEFTWRMLKVLFYERTANNIDVSESSLFEYCRLMQRLYLGYLNETKLNDRSWTTSYFVCPWLTSRMYCPAGYVQQKQQDEWYLEYEHSSDLSALQTVHILNSNSRSLPSGLCERLLICLHALLNKRLNGAHLTVGQAAEKRFIRVERIDGIRRIRLTIHTDLLDSIRTRLRQRLFSLPLDRSPNRNIAVVHFIPFYLAVKNRERKQKYSSYE